LITRNPKQKSQVMASFLKIFFCDLQDFSRGLGRWRRKQCQANAAMGINRPIKKRKLKKRRIVSGFLFRNCL